MKHNINKIIKDTEFSVQKRNGGWPGWGIYLRHKIFSKWSIVCENKTKPRLTNALKEKLVIAAIQTHENWKHNSPVWDELTNVSRDVDEYIHDFGTIFLRNNETKKIVIHSLEQNSDDVNVNEALQRLLDAAERYDKYRELKNSLKPTRVKWSNLNELF